MNEDNKKESWWKTLPGVLSGFAALLTAIGGLLVAFNQVGLFSVNNSVQPDNDSGTATVIAGIKLPTYVILDSAWEDKQAAQRRLVDLNHAGYSNTGFFWIPDFDFLSGAEMYQVYIGPFDNKLTAVGAVCDYQRNFSVTTYGVKLSQNPGREEVRCN